MLASPKGGATCLTAPTTEDRAEARDGGGGGSRTRVRKYAIAAIYMLSRSCIFATAVKERRKPAAASPDSSRRHASEQHVATNLLI